LRTARFNNGFDAFFTTTAALIDDLSAAFPAGDVGSALATYTHPAVLVVDEVGYLTYGTDAANMRFHVVNERHRRHRPMIFTTSKSLKSEFPTSVARMSGTHTKTAPASSAIDRPSIDVRPCARSASGHTPLRITVWQSADCLATLSSITGRH
jgi:hypothetical protein